MKAAIFTLCNYRYINYGQILQCYAFLEMCGEFGLEAKVVRYRDLRDFESIDMIPTRYGERDLYEKKYKEKNIESQNNEQVCKFNLFMEEFIDPAPICYTIDEVKDEVKDCDLLIVGSDQVWNPTMFTRVYLLDFAEANQRCLSYATGGVYSEREDAIDTFKLVAEHINHFYMVSVRERKSIDILKKYTNKEIYEVLDPTLMMGRAFWEQTCARKKYDDGYVLCFFIGLIQPHKHVAKEIAKRAGVKRIIYIKFNRSREQLADNDLFTAATGIGPRELLTLIKNANSVCTDSFHGIAFSIIFQKEFYLMDRAYIYDEGNDNLRMKSIMEKLGIGNRIVNSKKDLDLIEDISYEAVERNLSHLKQSSMEYFEKAISL